jgi:hypothetical protein
VEGGGGFLPVLWVGDVDAPDEPSAIQGGELIRTVAVEVQKMLQPSQLSKALPASAAFSSWGGIPQCE